jgi:hypothetical protein
MSLHGLPSGAVDAAPARPRTPLSPLAEHPDEQTRTPSRPRSVINFSKMYGRFLALVIQIIAPRVPPLYLRPYCWSPQPYGRMVVLIGLQAIYVMPRWQKG